MADAAAASAAAGKALTDAKAYADQAEADAISAAATAAEKYIDAEKEVNSVVDAINGAVCNYGRKVDFPTPANDKVVEIIHKIEKGELKPSFENLKYFK